MSNLVNLDQGTRRFMLMEFDDDLRGARLYFSPRLTPKGVADWPTLLRDEIEHGSDATLAAQLHTAVRLRRTEMKRTPKGRVTTAEVPVNAAQTLAEGEFNRFYIRGLCRRAIDEGIGQLVIFRARNVAARRPESEARIGKMVDPRKLLEDLRANIGIDPALGVPAGPNSGPSVRLP